MMDFGRKSAQGAELLRSADILSAGGWATSCRPLRTRADAYENRWISQPIKTTCGVEMSGSARAARQERVVARKLITSV